MNLVNWFGSWVVSYTFIFLFEWSSAGDASHTSLSLFLTLCGTYKVKCFGYILQVYSSYLQAFEVWVSYLLEKIVPETKGRNLEEIQASITHRLQEENQSTP